MCVCVTSPGSVNKLGAKLELGLFDRSSLSSALAGRIALLVSLSSPAWSTVRAAEKKLLFHQLFWFLSRWLHHHPLSICLVCICPCSRFKKALKSEASFFPPSSTFWITVGNPGLFIKKARF